MLVAVAASLFAKVILSLIAEIGVATVRTYCRDCCTFLTWLETLKIHPRVKLIRIIFKARWSAVVF